MATSALLSLITSPPPLYFHRSPPHSNLTRFSLLTKFPTWRQRSVTLKLTCSASEPDRNAEPEPEPETTSYSGRGDLTYKLCAGLGGIGFLETTYLTFLKLTNSDAFCPTGGGGGSCGDILNSDYAVVLGVPLPLFGMLAYGLVATLGLQLMNAKSLPFGIGKSDAGLVLLGTTTSMAAASACFLYILSTQFSGTSCSYCLLSAFLSFSLFFITLKDFGFERVQKEAGVLLSIAVLVAVTLNGSYTAPVSSSPADVDLPYFTTEITTPSTPFAIALAKHLNAVGAKMYGAFWCSHCVEQKQMFGREAAKELNYVECFPDGYRKGTIMAKACIDAKLEGFPTWEINSQVVGGEKDLLELAKESGFESQEFSQSLIE